MLAQHLGLFARQGAKCLDLLARQRRAFALELREFLLMEVFRQLQVRLSQ